MSEFVTSQLRGQKNIVDEGNGRILGELCRLTDVTKKTGRGETVNTGMMSIARIVENSGSAIAPGANAVFATDKFGTHIDGSPAADEEADGVVDPRLTANVETGDVFLLFVEGPCEIIASAAIVGPYVIPSGSGKFKTSLTAAAGASGRTLESGSGLSDGDTMRVYLNCQRN